MKVKEILRVLSPPPELEVPAVWPGHAVDAKKVVEKALVAILEKPHRDINPQFFFSLDSILGKVRGNARRVELYVTTSQLLAFRAKCLMICEVEGRGGFPKKKNGLVQLTGVNGAPGPYKFTYRFQGDEVLFD